MVKTTNQSTNQAVELFNRTLCLMDLAASDYVDAHRLHDGGYGKLTESELNRIGDQVSAAVDVAYDAAVLAFPALGNAPSDHRFHKAMTIRQAREMAGTI